ncbi:MAG: kelch repeat-containing protein [Bacteroidales bacterium]|nr:kelch repeat-containing protein [Bacteroidales bacterium]
MKTLKKLKKSTVTCCMQEEKKLRYLSLYRNVSFLLLLFLSSFSFGQKNTWTLINQNQTGKRVNGALVYAPDKNSFFLTLGSGGDSAAYSELMYNDNIGKWINFFPADTLYGPWGDSVGTTRGKGQLSLSVFPTPGYNFGFQNVNYGGRTYLRPNLQSSEMTRNGYAFRQYAYAQELHKIFYYVSNITFSYDTHTRRWDTIQPPTHPSIAERGGAHALRWGSMAYDPVNHEVLLAGGGGVDAKNGCVGTWVYKPSTRKWTKLNLATEPEPRAYTSMVYDEAHQKIILFGGDHMDYLTNDTWVYDCQTRTWTKKNPAIAPSPRAGHTLIYLPKSKTVVLYGGYIYNSETGYMVNIYEPKTPHELWKYDCVSNVWTLIKSFSSGTAPELGIPYNVIAAADTSDRILLLANELNYGHLVYEKTYTMHCDPSQTDPSGTISLGVAPNTKVFTTDPFDPAWFDKGVAAPDTSANETFLRNIPANTWINVAPPKRPACSRAWGTTCYDPDHDVIIKFDGGHSTYSGSEVPQYKISDNRWHTGYFPDQRLEYNNASGIAYYFTFNNRPAYTAHTYGYYDYDVNLKKMVAMLPRYTHIYNPVKMDWDTSIRNPSNIRESDYYNNLISTPHGVIAWTRSTTGSFNLYLFQADSLKWRQLPVSGAPILDSYCDNAGAGYDTKRDRLIMVSTPYGMEDKIPPYVGSYDFKTGVSTTINPPNNAVFGTPFYREAVYLPDIDMIMFSALTDGKHMFFDCATDSWKLIAIPKGPGVGDICGYNSGYMYDAKRKLVWDCEILSETYALRVTPDFVTHAEYPSAKMEVPEFSIYPNPLNSATNIIVNSTENVEVRIYNMMGKQVAAFKNEGGAGQKTFSWDASRFPSGVYCVRVTAGNRAMTKNITLVK